MTENFVVFDTSPFDDLNVLLDANMNGRYYHRRVSNPLTSMASLKLSVVVLYMHPINQKKKKYIPWQSASTKGTKSTGGQ